MNNLVLILFFFTYVSFSYGNTLEDKKEYLVGVEEIDQLPYYGYANGKSNEYEGLFRELLDDFAKKNNMSFVYKKLPIERLWHDFMDEMIDFKIPDNTNWRNDLKSNNKKEIFYSDAIVPFIDGIMVLSSNKNKGMSELKKISTPRGFTPFPYLSLIEEGKIISKAIGSQASGIKQVLVGRVDGYYGNIVVVKKILRDMGKNDQLVFNPNLLHDKSNYHLSTIKHPKIIKLFNQYLIKNEKFVSKLKRKLKIKI